MSLFPVRSGSGGSGSGRGYSSGASGPLGGTPAGGSSNSPSSIGPYPDDGARRMPVWNSPEALEAGRRRRREIASSSGRESTRLSSPGTSPYSNVFLGDAG